MGMGPDDDDHRLHISGYHRSHGGAHHPQLGKPKFAENQKIIQNQIYQHGRHSRKHGQLGLPTFSQSAGIGFLHCKRQKPCQHHPQILSPILQRHLQGLVVPFSVKIEENQIVPLKNQHQDPQKHNAGADIELKPQRMLQAFVIFTAKKLRAKNPHSGDGAENCQVKH